MGAIGVWAAASALTSAAGPVVGGWLTTQFGWHSIFWINPPFAAMAVALLWFAAPVDQIEPHRFDIVGASLIGLSLGLLAWSLSQIGSDAHRAINADMRMLGAGVIGLAGLGAYVIWERMSTHPMTPPRLPRTVPLSD